MKTILIKTQKRKNNLSKEYLQVDIQKRFFPNKLSNKILLIHIDLENIELLINDEDLNFLVNKILEYKLNDNFYINHEKIMIKEVKLLDDVKNNCENKENQKGNVIMAGKKINLEKFWNLLYEIIKMY